jgi:signal transduction histidine kinase/ActR/RegA family two-component response regulator
MKLAWKLAIPQICIVVALGLIGFAVINASFTGIREQYVRDTIENRFQVIANDIEASSKKSIGDAAVFVSLPIVSEAFEIANSGDINDINSPKIQEARNLLREGLTPILDNYNEATGENIDLHFRLPGGQSLLRLKGDDMTSAMTAVPDTGTTGDPAVGLIFENEEFILHGMVAVYAPDGRQLGSVEVLQGLSFIIENITEEGKIHIALFANKELVDSAEPFGDFVTIAGLNDKRINPLITTDFLSQGKSSVNYETHGYITLATLPLLDYKDEQVGVLVLALSTENMTIVATTAAFILAIIIISMAVVPTFALMVRFRSLAVEPLNQIKSKIRDIAEDRISLDAKILLKQKDEIGDLAKWFNTLSAKVDAIMKERQEMAHWYKSILDTIPLLISVQDVNMKWTFLNKEAEKILGRKREDVLGLQCKNWGLSICDTENCSIVSVKKGKSKTVFTHGAASYHVDVTELKNLQNEVTGFIEIMQDFTEWDLIVKQRLEAETRDRAKSDFLANVSHEMRTPLNAIMGMTRIGKDSHDPERVTYTFGKIEEASSQLLDVINDILDVAQIESGEFRLLDEEFNIEEMLLRIAKDTSLRAAEKKQEFNAFLDKSIPAILRGDEKRLSQAVMNLLSNAIKFTPDKGTISIEARLLNIEDGFCNLCVLVKDTGIGISPQQKEELFSSFHQAEESMSRKYGGTGLGLTISKNIAEMMGGDIKVRSELGEGSVFALTVRLKCVGTNVTEEKNSINLTGKKILLAEDVDINREVIKVLLEPTFVEIDFAENGAEAVRIFKEAPDKYDLIFMDLQMPEMDGFEATRQIRALGHAKAKSVPIIALTANVSRDDIEKCHKAGMDHHLGKPIDFEKIIDILKRYLPV